MAPYTYRYIVRSPDVRGGNARLEGTRIAVHDVIGLLQNGETVESITATCLPMLTQARVYECLAYYGNSTLREETMRRRSVSWFS